MIQGTQSSQNRGLICRAIMLLVIKEPGGQYPVCLRQAVTDLSELHERHSHLSAAVNISAVDLSAPGRASPVRPV